MSLHKTGCTTIAWLNLSRQANTPGICRKILLYAALLFLPLNVMSQESDDAEIADEGLIVVDDIDDQQENADKPGQLEPRFYVGIGAGGSNLEPDTSEVTESVADGSQTGYQLTFGADLNKWLSLELHAADLGSAEISNGGEISYREYGLSGIFYAGDNRGNYNRQGFTLFGRAGVGTLSNDSKGENVDFDKEEGVNFILGAGAEYAMRNGLAVRAEGLAFDEDVSYLQLGLLYRFGNARKFGVPSIGLPSIKWPLAGITNRFGKKKSLTKGKPLPGDLDGDGIGDLDDDCEQTSLGQPIDDKGCPVFGGVIEGLNFVSGSAELTDSAKTLLDDLSEQLLAYPDMRIRVAAHTDSYGDDQENMLLSRRRALTVSKHLVSAGISKFRLEAIAYGETRPIADNSTKQGRAQNRRVELTAVP